MSAAASIAAILVAGTVSLSVGLGFFVARNRADPRKCFDCRKPVTPGMGLCANCFEGWRKERCR